MGVISFDPFVLLTLKNFTIQCTQADVLLLTYLFSEVQKMAIENYSRLVFVLAHATVN